MRQNNRPGMVLAFAPSRWKSQIDLAWISVRICWDLNPKSNRSAEMFTSKWNTLYIEKFPWALPLIFSERIQHFSTTCDINFSLSDQLLSAVKGELGGFWRYRSALITPQVFYVDVNSIPLSIVETFSTNQRLCGMIWEGSEIHWW
jgi:hypothetical protein